MQHAVTTLRVRNGLATDAADLVAHVAIDKAPQSGHACDIVHAIADEQSWMRGPESGGNKAVDLFGSMLAIRVKNNDKLEATVKDVPTQVGALTLKIVATVVKTDEKEKAVPTKL